MIWDPSTPIIEEPTVRVRLAQNASDVRAAQRLRYIVFFQERGIAAPSTSPGADLDQDPFDEYADVLMVIQRDSNQGVQVGDEGELIGIYRLIDKDKAAQHSGFVLDSEFDVWPMIRRNADQSFIEVSRGVIAQEHRSRLTINLLWRGIILYHHIAKIDVLFGAASFATTDPSSVADCLAVLAADHTPPPQYDASAVAERYVEMENTALAEASNRALIQRELPPLIKGYLKLGAYIGRGAVIDYEFSTVDVLIIVPMANIPPSRLRFLSRGHARG